MYFTLLRFQVMPRLNFILLVLQILEVFVGVVQVHEDGALYLLQLYHVFGCDITTGWQRIESARLHFVPELLQEDVSLQCKCRILVGERELLLHLPLELDLFFNFVVRVVKCLQAQLLAYRLPFTYLQEPFKFMVTFLCQLFQSFGVQVKHRFVETLIGDLVGTNHI